MLVERAAEHFEGNGYAVERDPILRTPIGEFRPNLLVSRGDKRSAVLVDDDPLGAYQIGSFAAYCKKAGIRAVVVCPGTPDVFEACEERGVDHLSPEGLGAPVLVRRGIPLSPVPVEAAAPATPVAESAAIGAPTVEGGGFVWWRWGIVAAIWAAAIYFVVKLIGEIAA